MILIKFASCHEEGVNGVNQVNQAGSNFWIENVVGGSNQTYLSLYAEVKILVDASMNWNLD